GDHSASEENSRHFGADDVAHSKVFGSDRGAEGSAREPTRARFRLAGPRLNRIHQKGVDSAQTQPPKHASGKRTAPLARYSDVGAGRDCGNGAVAMLLDGRLSW